MGTMLLPNLDETLVAASRVARQRVGETAFVRDAAKGAVPYESYATVVRSVGGIVRQLEGALMRRPSLATFARSGLGLRHAITRDVTVVSAFARALPVSGRVWRARIERLEESSPELLVAHMAVFHLDCPFADDRVVDGLRSSTGLTPSRGLEMLAASGVTNEAGRDRWSSAAAALGADRAMRVVLIAEANLACALLEQMLNEIHSADHALVV